MFRHLLKIFSFLIFALVFSILGSIVLDKAKAWVEAPAAPPGYGLPGCTSPCEANDFKAISRGSVDEYKTGKLGILNAGDYINYGLTVGNSASNIGSIKAENSSATPTGYFANYGSGPAIQLGAGGIKFSDGTTQNTSSSVWASNGANIYNTNTGNVGIGTTSPLSPLSIANGDGTYGGLWVGQGTGKGWIYYGNSATDWKVGKMNTTTNNFEIRHHDDTSYLAVTPTGNVGIGTTNPAEKLEVTGTIRQAGASADGTTGIHIGDSAVRLFQTNDGNKSLGIYTNATEKVRILGNGNVGIGEVTPTSKLHVMGTIYADNVLEVSGGQNSGTAVFMGNAEYNAHRSVDNTIAIGNFVSGSTMGFDFYTANSAKMRITSSGNVGIGTAPTVKLEVAGEGKFGVATSQQQQVSIQGSNAGTNLIAAGHEAASLNLANLDGGANTFAGVKFRDAGGNYVAGISGIFIDNASNRGELAFITRNGVDINERMRIDKGGNVGIGTTGPAAKLQVNPNTNTEGVRIISSNYSPFIVRNSNDTADLFRIDENGNVTGGNAGAWTRSGTNVYVTNTNDYVGIGTTNPAEKLEVTGTIRQAGASADGTTGIHIGDSAVRLFQTNDGNKSLGIYTNATEKVRILGNGNVGIGTPTPLAKLDVFNTGGNDYERVMVSVNGNFPKIYFGNGLAYNSYIGYNYAGNEAMVLNSRNDVSHYEFQIAGFEKVRIDSAGRVGIGTAIPIAKLQVHSTGSDVAYGYFTAAGTGGAGIVFDASNGDVVGGDYGWLRQNDDLSVQLLNVGANPLHLGVDNSIDMSVISGGNVGIGTTGPAAKLQVNPNTNTEGVRIISSNYSPFIVRNSNDTADLFRIDENGNVTGGNAGAWTRSGTNVYVTNTGDNVGIGTTNPGTVKLYTQSSQSGDWASVIKNTTAGGYGLSVDCSACVNNTYGLAVYTGVGTGMFVKNDTGNVGIGTTDPKAKLSFAELNDGRDTADGITWYNPMPTRYGIYRTSGSWLSPNYQQLRLQWDTGIILDPGKDYGKSYVEIAQGGLRVTSGNVGIGTVPATKLHVSAGNTSSPMRIETTSGESDINFLDGTRNYQVGINGTGFYVHDGSYRLTIAPSSGYVGIGTGADAPNYKLEVKGSSAYDSVSLDPSTLNFGKIQFSTLGSYIGYDYNGLERMVLNSRNIDSHYEFQINDSEKVRIDSNGNVGIGTASPGTYKLYVAGDIYTNTSGTSVGGWFTSSDARLKKNVETLSGSLDKIGRVRGVSYNLIDGSSDRQIGVIAQELEQEFPELVKTDDKGYKSVSYDKLSAVLIESVKELKSQNQSLQQRLDILEKRQ